MHADLILRDKIYIARDSELMSPAHIKSRYRVELFKESQCGKCSNRPYRPNDICATCPAFMGTHVFYNKEKIGKREYVSLPIADIQHVKEHLRGKKFTAVNEMAPRRMRHPLKFTGKLFRAGDVDDEGNPRADQEALVGRWLRERNGIIEAAPRTGKTVMAAYLACALGLRTLVVAHQFELLDQFYATFMGGGKHKRKPMTNAKALAKKLGQPTVKVAESFDDLKDTSIDVLLINPQKFYRNLDRMKKVMSGRWGLLIVDEVHQGYANVYASVLSRIDAPYRLGLSATPARKDSRDALTNFVVGPVTAVSQAVTLRPMIKLRETATVPPYKHKTWNGAQQWASGSPERNKEIIRAVFADLRAGHKTVILPVAYLKHQDTLVKVFNAAARKYNKEKKENWPLDLAVAFNARCDRKYALDRADDDKPCVLVAVSSMIKQGIDLKVPTSLHLVFPMSATRDVGSPMFLQMSYRVSTPMPGKRQPEVTIWADAIDMFRGCLQGLFWNEIVPGVKSGKYLLAPDTYAAMSNIGRGRSGSGGSSSKSSRLERGKWV